MRLSVFKLNKEVFFNKFLKNLFILVSDRDINTIIENYPVPLPCQGKSVQKKMIC